MLSKAQFCAGLNVVAQYGVPRIDASTEYDVGSEAFLSYFEDEVLHSMVFLGGAAVRFIEGPFGSGKTHLLELIEASALKNNMAIAVTQLDHDLKLDNWSQITKHVLNSLEVRINGEKARSLPDILDLLERFGTADYKRLKEHPLPHAGIKRAMLIYHETQNNTHARFKLAEFLRGERTGAGELSRVGVKGVKGPLSHRNAEQVLKTVLGGLFYLGLNGTALLFDETEQGFRSNRASQKIRVSANLMRRLIDGSASGTLVGTVVLFAILPGFIEACGRAYPALGQRLETVGSESEPGAWRQPVLTIDNISSVRNQDEFMHAICSKFVELVKYYGGKTDGLYDLMISRSTEILEKDASSGYRRSMVKLLAAMSMEKIRGEPMLDQIRILKTVAQYGHAPKEGCRLFGANYDEAFDRLKREYIKEQFSAGISNEKFVIGPFGSGKSHFMRQFMEIARDEQCVTAEVMLNKDIDFTDNLSVYCEVARELRIPGRIEHGIRALLLESVERMAQEAGDIEIGEVLINSWIKGLPLADFKETKFARIAGMALEAYRNGEEPIFEAACRWLSGEADDAFLAKQLSISPIRRAERAGFGRRMLLSLCQFVRYAGFVGTVVVFDESEQGLAKDGKQREKILSMLQSGVNAFADLQNGSALIIYGLTPDISEKFDSFAALQQRLADPIPGKDFFAGSTLSPKIDLKWREDPYEGLKRMGCKFVDMLYDANGDRLIVPRGDAYDFVETIARDVYDNDSTSGNRRNMAKRTAALLINLYENGVLEITDEQKLDVIEKEV